MAFTSVLQVSPSHYAPRLRSSFSVAHPVCAFGAHKSIAASVKPSASMSLASPSGCSHQLVSRPSVAPSLVTLSAPFSAILKVCATRGVGCCSGSLPSTVALANSIGRRDGERREIRFGFPSKGGMADDTVGLLKVLRALQGITCSASMSPASPSGCYHQLVSRPSIAPSLVTLGAPFSAILKVSATRGVGCCSGSLPSAVALANSIGRRDGERREIRFGFPSKGGMADDTVSLLKPSNLQVLFQRVNDILRKLLSGDLGIGIGDFDTVSEYDQAAFFPYISAGDPDLSTSAKPLKVLDTCGSELYSPYYDPLADGPGIQAAATQSLARDSHSDAIQSMLKVVLLLSSPVALFSKFYPILKLGFEKFMSILKNAGIRGQRPPRVYDVFISYKQHDTLHFVSHLKNALDRRGIKTFVDSTLEGGVEVQPAIEEAIEQSEIAVVIVSQNYHLSPWCLIELEKILECQRKWGLIVLPILRGMDAKDLREQPRHFVENIGQGEKGFKQEQPHQFQKWRDALRALGMIKALPVLCSSVIPEATVIEDAVDQISARVNRSV